MSLASPARDSSDRRFHAGFMDFGLDTEADESESEMPKPATQPGQIRQGVVIGGPFIPESMEVLAVIPFGSSLKVIGRGTKTGKSYDPVS